MLPDVVLKTTGLGKRYGRRWAVQNLDLVVRRGEVFGFLGPNGAGKSTTIRMILSLVTPTTGSIELFGKSFPRNRGEVLKRVGGSVERPDFYPYLSARRTLESLAALQGRIAPREIDDVLSLVGLGDRAGEKVGTYSQGMKQRLGIAQALLGNPEFLILDEPTSGLDPQGIKEVRDLVRRLSGEQGKTVFLSSHLLHEIEQTATAMAIIHHGNLAVQGSVKELLLDREVIVHIDARPIDRALVCLERHPSVTHLRRVDDRIEFYASRNGVAEVNRALVQNGIEVSALVPRRSLEEFFLSITEGLAEKPLPSAGKSTDTIR